MPKTWSLYEAKNRLSEVIERAKEEGPQIITRRGRVEAVVLSVEAYRRLKGQPDLYTLIRASPLHGLELDLGRDKSPPREVEL